jgi:hypothetical protein
MRKEDEAQPEPTIVEVLNDELKKSHNGLDDLQTVESIAGRMGVGPEMVHLWLEQDKQFKEGLQAVKRAHDIDPWKDTEYDDIKLDEFAIMFGISIVVEETKKRYTV